MLIWTMKIAFNKKGDIIIIFFFYVYFVGKHILGLLRTVLKNGKKNINHIMLNIFSNEL